MQIALANSHWPFLKRQRCSGLPSATLSHNVLFPPSGNGGYNRCNTIDNQNVFFCFSVYYINRKSDYIKIFYKKYFSQVNL